MKAMNATPIKPVIINVMPKPLNGAGTFEYLIFSRIAAIATMARNHPTPEPSPKDVASAMQMGADLAYMGTRFIGAVNSD